jgi:tRNA(fMet)-specific endonuclease VapC
LIYLLDTNTITDLIEGHLQVISNMTYQIRNGHRMALCLPVRYEVERGLVWKNMQKKLHTFRSIYPRLDLIDLTSEDWLQAVQFWVDSRSTGKQLADIDILIAAMASRLRITIVSSDTDFDALPVQRENWRLSLP